jgi:hypothetical protein
MKRKLTIMVLGALTIFSVGAWADGPAYANKVTYGGQGLLSNPRQFRGLRVSAGQKVHQHGRFGNAPRAHLGPGGHTTTQACGSTAQ